ncbi:DUF1835 domain-containing protein [Limibacter armeniacum]|uniref:DUF1835 domain-containing protein n=1 Tax=Limibacter armeniacum TaxID=466084 RepID=UPI002FE52D3E
MHKTLHILNGDGLLHSFKESQIKGDIAIFRETLCTGPVHPDVASEDFWKIRAAYFEADYEIDNPNYQEKTINEFEEKISSLCQYDQVVFWFEHDLFCQINQLALISYAHLQQCSNTQFFQVPFSKLFSTAKYKGLAELPPQSLVQLYKNKTLLTEEMMEKNHLFWKMYCDPDPRKLHELIKENHPDSTDLYDAFLAHFRRFPHPISGIGSPERLILNVINESPKPRRKVLGSILMADSIYGYGDLIFEKILDYLSPLYDNHEMLTLNETGLKVLNNEKNFLELADDKFYMGGSTQQDFYWDGLLIKR